MSQRMRQEVAMNLISIALAWILIVLAQCASAQAAEQERALTAQGTPPAGPEARIIDKWRGTWDVKAMRKYPQPAGAVTYTETFEWVLDGRFLHSETSRKSDGSKEGGKSMSMFWYDILTKSYRYVIFDAGGFGIELPPPGWNEATQTMEWTSGMFSPISYTGHATFSDRDTIRWKSLLKDWKGTVVLEIEGTSVRRK